jgi:hypothetical protein
MKGFHLSASIGLMVMSILACRPVLAISWNEFLIVGVLFAALLGPPIFRWIQRVTQFFKQEKNNK